MQGSLRIGRLRADCRVTGPELVATAVRDRTTRALRDHLPPALRRGFARWLDSDDESVWIVRRLDLTVLTATETPSDELAAIMVTSLGRALTGALTGDGDGVNAIRFPRRAAYLAQFAVDAASGDAWSRWYYAPLGGWRPLPRSAAIRAALVEDPLQGLAALASLDDSALAHVVECLAPPDERALLEAFARATPSGTSGEDSVLRFALDACARAFKAAPARGQALFAFVRAARPPSMLLLQSVDAITAAFAAAEADGPTARAEATRRVETDLGIRIPGSVIAESVKPREPTAGEGSQVLFVTRFGGISLLLRDLDALPWSTWTAEWPCASTATPSALMRWLTVALCAGRAKSLDALDDAAWRALFDIRPDLTVEDVSRWLGQVGAARCRALAAEAAAPELTKQERTWLAFPRRAGLGKGWSETFARIARLVLRGFARRLPGFAESTPDHLWRNFLSFDASIELEDDRVLVFCGRPPLHLVLAITGMTRGLMAGRDPRSRPILVFPRE